MKTVFIATAVLIVFALAVYAGWLHYRLWFHKRQANGVDRERNQTRHNPDPQRVELKKSIYLLADAMLDEKMTITEGCMRICAMANHLDDREQFLLEYGVLYRVAEDTAHIPILDDWKALGNEEKRRLDMERRAIEQKYNDAVLDAAQRVRNMFL